LDIARACGLEANSEAAKRWLSNLEDPWLLIIDNADDPLQDVSEYFPTGDRGVILLTTRNPDCKVHATVGSRELGQMDPEDAITLLLKTTAAEDVAHEASRNLARPIVETLGCLALAIIQAGAVIRQKLCSMEEYLDVYSRRRKQLLSHQHIQAKADYKYTVYTTWEVSVNMIENMSNNAARNAIEILQFFSFMHFDGLSEEILKEAWKNMQGQQLSRRTKSHQLRMFCEDDLTVWEPRTIREAVILLSSFSLVTIDGVNNHISMHPLVHMWARDRLVEVEQKMCWEIAASTLAMSISWNNQTFDYSFRRFLLPHVNSCLSSHGGELFTTDEGELERLKIAAAFALVYQDCGRLQEAMKLEEKVVEAMNRTLGEEHPDTLTSMNNLAISYSDLGRRQEAMELKEKVVEASKRTLGQEHPDTLSSMNNLANSYSDLGRRQEAMELREKVVEASKRTLGQEHPDTLRSMNNLAISYGNLSRRQEAMKLREEVLEARKRTLGREHPDTLRSAESLAFSYNDLGRRQEATELREKALEAMKRTLGQEHPATLTSMNNLAISYSDLGRRQEAIELMKKVLEIRKRVLGEEHPDTLISMNNLAIFSSSQTPLVEALEQHASSGGSPDKPLNKKTGSRWNKKGWIGKHFR
jgi:tetratricopeptide (TPR) repeat protein